MIFRVAKSIRSDDRYLNNFRKSFLQEVGRLPQKLNAMWPVRRIPPIHPPIGYDQIGSQVCPFQMRAQNFSRLPGRFRHCRLQRNMGALLLRIQSVDTNRHNRAQRGHENKNKPPKATPEPASAQPPPI